jgi:hypothetical protein
MGDSSRCPSIRQGEISHPSLTDANPNDINAPNVQPNPLFHVHHHPPFCGVLVLGQINRRVYAHTMPRRKAGFLFS